MFVPVMKRAVAPRVAVPRSLTMLRSSVRTPAIARAALHSTPHRAEDAKTGLYDFHVKNGAKMVTFGGYSMPLTYEDVGQVASHKHVREHAGLFDVGHMVQHMCVVSRH
jgi:aminomethyltransferase